MVIYCKVLPFMRFFIHIVAFYVSISGFDTGDNTGVDRRFQWKITIDFFRFSRHT
jgi:hypothetical protein